MLRYVCLLLLLLVCIKCSFCYDYMPEEDPRSVKKLRKDVKRQRRQRVEDNKHHREYDDSLAEIDVASFIQKPDYEATNENHPIVARHPHRKQIAKSNIDYRSLAKHHINNEQRKYKNVPNAPANPLDSLNVNIDSYGMAKHDDPERETAEANIVHKTQKKCPLKDIKFPFFSHKKAASPKPRKGKKRKLFSFRNSVKYSDAKPDTPKTSKPKLEDNALYDSFKVRKRSYGERICPLCKRKYVTNLKENAEAQPHNFIHNSRQYFKHLSDLGKSNTKAETVDVSVSEADCENSINPEMENSYEGRNKRATQETDRERQLKELEEVQKKIDNLDIQFQKFPKEQNDNNSS